jgi:hypothetical protein
MKSLPKDGRTFEAQRAPRAVANALTAAETLIVVNGLTSPAMGANIEPQWTVIGTHAALDTAQGIRNHLCCGQRVEVTLIDAEQFLEHGPPAVSKGESVFYLIAITFDIAIRNKSSGPVPLRLPAGTPVS